MKKLLLFIILLLCNYQIHQTYSQWKLLSGPSGGYFDYIIATNPNTFFVTSNMGVYRSVDNTATWESVNNGVDNFFRTRPHAIAGNDNTIIFGTYGHYVYQAVVYLSVDGGNSWSTAFDRTRIYSALVKDNYIFFCGTYDNKGIFRSSDNGSTWENILPENSEIHLFSKDNYIFYNHERFRDTIARSSDYGDTWQTLLISPCYSMAAYNNFLIFSAGNYLYRSSDYGNTWDSVYAGVVFNSLVQKDNYLFGANKNTGKLYRSSDIGATWQQLNTNGLWIVNIIKQGDELLITGNNVQKSTDNGNTWISVNTGLPNLYVYSLFVKYNYMIAGTDEGISVSTNNGFNWSDVYDNRIVGSGNGFIESFAILNDVFIAGTGTGLFRSTNFGATWIEIDSLLPGINTNIVIGTVNGMLILNSQNGNLYRSSNLGNSWNVLPVFSGGPVKSFMEHNNYLFAFTSNNIGLFRSSDSGFNWQIVNSGINNSILGDTIITGITSAGNDLYLATKNRVFKSTNEGGNWQSIQGDLPNNTFNLRGITAAQGFLYTACRYDGIYISSNGGENWILSTAGLENKYFNTIVSNDDFIYVGTASASGPVSPHESGVYQVPAGIMVNIQNNNIPSRFVLSQNYPNPFNPRTIIDYQLPIISNVRLSVFDITGREISILVNQKQAAGNYNIEWDASGFASGVYFYKLETTDFTETKKMVLLK